MNPTQRILPGSRRYKFREIKTSMSLKNSHTFIWGGQERFAATDMINGGTVIYYLGYQIGPSTQPSVHMFHGKKMMWAPNINELGNGLHCYCCDTGGSAAPDWWNYMRIYRNTFNLSNKTVGPLTKVDVFEDSCGLIDPYLFQIGEWWYLFYAKLWDEKDKEWWDPHYSVSRSPLGPFEHEVNLEVPERGIDEAFKVVRYHDRFICTWSSGDSGINGSAFLGELVCTGQHSDGWLYLKAKELAEVKAFGSDLCTALDISLYPRIKATLRHSGYSGMRDGFYIGELV